MNRIPKPINPTTRFFKIIGNKRKFHVKNVLNFPHNNTFQITPYIN